MCKLYTGKVVMDAGGDQVAARAAMYMEAFCDIAWQAGPELPLKVVGAFGGQPLLDRLKCVIAGAAPAVQEPAAATSNIASAALAAKPLLPFTGIAAEAGET